MWPGDLLVFSVYSQSHSFVPVSNFFFPLVRLAIFRVHLAPFALGPSAQFARSQAKGTIVNRLLSVWGCCQG
jgi:hypothetical protein